MINQIESVQKIKCVNSVDTVNFVAGQGGIWWFRHGYA